MTITNDWWLLFKQNWTGYGHTQMTLKEYNYVVAVMNARPKHPAAEVARHLHRQRLRQVEYNRAILSGREKL
jgi:hypothetical protein